MIEVVQENCGNFESWASDVVSHYGGADGELSEKEFLVAYQEISGYDGEDLEIIYATLSGDDENVRAEDLVAHANDVVEAA